MTGPERRRRERPTSDLEDAHGSSLEVCELPFRASADPVSTARSGPVRCLDDNALVRATISARGDEAVLVVDGGASLRSALIGDQMAGLALAYGWSGAVICGAVRDTVTLASLDFGIKVLGTTPRRSARIGTGGADVIVHFGSVSFRPGAWLYSDEDGIVVTEVQLPD